MWIFLKKMIELFANSGDPDQTPRSAASDMGLHCLPVIHLGPSVFNGLTDTEASYMSYNLPHPFWFWTFERAQYLPFEFNPFMPSGLCYLNPLDRSFSNRRSVWLVLTFNMF